VNTRDNSLATEPSGSLDGRATPRVCLVGPSRDELGGQSLQAWLLFQRLADSPAIDVDFLPINPRLPGPLRLFQRIKYVRTVVTTAAYVASLLLRTRRYDVLHVFSASYWSFILSAAPAILIGKLFGRAVLLNYHSGEADDHLTRSRRVAVPLLLRADVIVVPSEYLVDVFRRHGLTAVAVANFVDLDELRYRRREKLRPIFLGNRNFFPLYNVGGVVRAFARVRRHHHDARLVLAGEGPCRPSLEHLVEELEIHEAVHFTGQVSPARMAELYDEADLYLNSSDIDNMPLSILEAFACGLVVVTTNAGGIPYLVDHERTGLLVDRGDDHALAREALRLLDDPEMALRLADTAHGECRERYTWEAVQREWLRIYEEIAPNAST